MTMKPDDEETRFQEIIAAEDPDLFDVIAAIELLRHQLNRIEGKLDELAVDYDE